MGGNQSALKLYIGWRDAIKDAKARVRTVRVHLEGAESAQKALRDWEEQGTDPDLIQSFRVNWETRVEETVEELARAEKAYTSVCTTRKKLAGTVVQALADAYVKYPYVTPVHLLSLHKTLKNNLEPDHVAPVRTRVNELRRRMREITMSVRRALVELDMWDGCRNMPAFTRNSVSISFARAVRSIHPDKNDGRVETRAVQLEQVQNARNCLHQHLENIPTNMEIE